MNCATLRNTHQIHGSIISHGCCCACFAVFSSRTKVRENMRARWKNLPSDTYTYIVQRMQSRIRPVFFTLFLLLVAAGGDGSGKKHIRLENEIKPNHFFGCCCCCRVYSLRKLCKRAYGSRSTLRTNAIVCERDAEVETKIFVLHLTRGSQCDTLRHWNV